MAIKHNLNQKQKRSKRIHHRVCATPNKPKLLITRSNKSIYLQVINHQGKIIAASCNQAVAKKQQLKKLSGSKTQQAQAVGEALAATLKAAKIKTVCVDRGACKYHGRLKAAVEAVKQAGVEI